MKILTFKRLIGLTVIGGVAYVHKQRGGEWTVAGIKDTLRYLWSSARETMTPVKDAARGTRDRAPIIIDPPARSGLSETPQSYGNSPRKDDSGRH